MNHNTTSTLKQRNEMEMLSLWFRRGAWWWAKVHSPHAHLSFLPRALGPHDANLWDSYYAHLPPQLSHTDIHSIHTGGYILSVRYILTFKMYLITPSSFVWLLLWQWFFDSLTVSSLCSVWYHFLTYDTNTLVWLKSDVPTQLRYERQDRELPVLCPQTGLPARKLGGAQMWGAQTWPGEVRTSQSQESRSVCLWHTKTQKHTCTVLF